MTSERPQINVVLIADDETEHKGSKITANSVPVTLASDQDAIAITFTSPSARTGISSATFQLGSPTSGTLIPMLATDYVEPTSEAQRSVSSDDANDTSAGTGARTMKIVYFDNTGDGPFEETVTLNGTTPVNTVATDIRFIEKMLVLTAGSSGANEGTITLHSATAGGGSDIGTISFGILLSTMGDNQTKWAHHYVPVGWVVELAVLQAAIQSGGSGTSGKFFIRASQPLIADTAEVVEAGVLLLPGSFQRSFQFHTRTSGFARLVAYCIPSVNNTEVSASFDWSEVPE